MEVPHRNKITLVFFNVWSWDPSFLYIFLSMVHGKSQRLQQFGVSLRDYYHQLRLLAAKTTMWAGKN